MKKITFFTLLLLFVHLSSDAQVSTNSNFSNNTSFFVGWDNNVTFPLNIRHDAAGQPINILTDGLLRQRFTTTNWTGLNGLTLNNATRCFISVNGSTINPVSILHLGQSNSNNAARNWMHIGTTMTNSGDHMYVGLMQRPTATNFERTDAVINWGCNDQQNAGADGPDNLRFIFTTVEGGVGSGGTNQGRETMRVTPNGRVGVGDFSGNVANQGISQPNYIGATLDVDGDLRIRAADQDNTLTQVLVRDPNDLGRVHWRDAATLGGSGGACDWNILGSNLVTGFPGACVTGNVGINTPFPFFKFHVKDAMSRFENTVGGTAVNATVSGGTGVAAGISSFAQPGAFGFNVFGVRSIAGLGCSPPYNDPGIHYGVYGLANGAKMNRSIYGLQGCEDADSWAAWFDGKGFHSAGIWQTSDAMLKQDIQEVTGMSAILMQLKPKSYFFQTEAFKALKLPSGLQYGLIAQDLQEVLPNLVVDTFHPGELDDEGNPIGEGFNFKAVNYTELTPILIAGHQEQQSAIDALKAEIEAMKAQMAECCAKATDKSSTGSNSTGSDTQGMDFDLQIEKATLDQNVPNPFQNETSITYRIPAQAQVRVRILGQNGQQVDTLVDGMMPKGEYRIVWNASHLPAGLYFYTLEADGVELVKKAVKL